MNPTRMQTEALQRFTCLGAECPDTCCQGWAMQVTAETVAQYKVAAPELLDAVTQQGEGQFVMKRNPTTDACVKLEAGWCAIQRDYSKDFLGDACYFYPRITRALNDTIITTAMLSCPETARLMLSEEGAFQFGERSELRIPYVLRNYLPEGMTADAALAIHHAFIAMAGDADFSAAHNLMRISAVARAIEMQPTHAWEEAVPIYLTMVEGRIPPAEASPYDLCNLVHALHGLMVASESMKPRFVALVDAIAAALHVRFDETGAMHLDEDASAYAIRLLAHMRTQETALQPVYRRYLQAQLSQALFPFSGLGKTLSERVTVIGVRFATLRLAVALLPAVPAQQDVITTVQTLARFMDHLADATLSLDIYRETGWARESRLRAMIGDA